VADAVAHCCLILFLFLSKFGYVGCLLYKTIPAAILTQIFVLKRVVNVGGRTNYEPINSQSRFTFFQESMLS